MREADGGAEAPRPALHAEHGDAPAMQMAALETPGSTHSGEEALVAAAVRGDEAAFAELYDRHYDRVYRHVYYRVGRSQDAEDLTQQVFLQAWRAVGRYRQTGSSFAAWLLAIAHNAIMSFFRRNKVAFSLEHDLAAGREDGSRQHEAHAERERVRQAIRRLKPDQQQVVTMRFLEDLPYGDVASALGKSEVNVRVIQHRALQDLRRILEREER